MSEPTGQLDAFGQAVGKVRKYYHHAKLQRRSLSQVEVFEKLTAELGNSNRHTQQQAMNVTELKVSVDTSDEMSPVRVPKAAEPKNMLRK